VVGDHTVGDEIVDALDGNVVDTFGTGRLDAFDLDPTHPNMTLGLRKMDLIEHRSHNGRIDSVAPDSKVLWAQSHTVGCRFERERDVDQPLLACRCEVVSSVQQLTDGHRTV